ncbi:hypothetical protein CDAR_256351 [Caerostris darwini]|uniref:Uncharacterized protein n=1 Tax=Caerostris darwini TaxID=1538125 RepID=A0AAV4NUX2_9ARAC|nr:hypothetical protein CDAR_256351 [Caerostris darwini]
MRWDRSLSLINTSIDQTPVPLRLIRAIKPDSWGSKGRTRAFSPCIPNQTGGRKRCRGVKFFWTFSSVTSSEKELANTDSLVLDALRQVLHRRTHFVLPRGRV